MPDQASDKVENQLDGEPPPVIVAGEWRFAIASVTVAAEIPELDLDGKLGRDWVLLVADVTNWTSTDGVFNLRLPLLQNDQMTEPWDIAPSSTAQVATLLDFSHQTDEHIQITAGETVRVVLVYSIPEAGGGLSLIIGEEWMTIYQQVQASFDQALPQLSQPPDLVEGTLLGASAVSDGSLAIEVSTVDGSEIVFLLGVMPSTSAGCSVQVLYISALLLSQSALIETDPAVNESAGVYLWIVNDDGKRSLLNEILVSEGSVDLIDLPGDERFGAWLEAAEADAQAAGLGLWGSGCV